MGKMGLQICFVLLWILGLSLFGFFILYSGVAVNRTRIIASIFTPNRVKTALCKPELTRRFVDQLW